MRLKLTLSLLALTLAACAPATSSPTLAPTATRPAFTPIPTFTATSEASSLELSVDEPGTVALDFVARVCEAKWTNNAFEIPCPGDPNDIARGYIQPSDHALIEGGLTVDGPVLIALPGQGGGNGSGLFGQYPAITIQPGDRFKAMAACQGDAPCEAEFALEYFDANGKYHAENNWGWKHRAGGGAFQIDLDLSPLAGQTVEFLLVIREQGTPQDAWSVWIQPRILRTLDAQPGS